MKENLMKYDRKLEVELELSEEQMQEITGGCTQCTADLAKVFAHRSTAVQHMEYANNALRHVNQSQGLTDKIFFEKTADGHLEFANAELNKAHNLYTQIIARGHR
jgi:hypothetical protein